MRDKIYMYVLAGIFFILFLWCPAVFIIENAGLIEIEDLANYKDPEKVYYFDTEERSVKIAAYGAVPDEHKSTGNVPLFARMYMNTFNGIEESKASIDTIYTNYLPFYADVLKFLNSTDSNIQDEFVLMLYNMESSKNNIAAGNTVPTETPVNEISNIDIDSADSNELENITPTEPIIEPPQLNFIASKVSDAGMFRVYRVRSTDDSIGFLDISMAMRHDIAARNMLDEQAHINRIAAANTDVNFFVYIASRMQDTAYYNTIVPSEPSTNDILEDFVNGITEAAGVTWFDIGTFEKRMELCFKTDHHWNALGAYQGYTEIINMMNKVVPIIGEPLPLKGLIEFPNVEYRGSGAGRTQTPVYYDTFAVMDIDLPVQHPTERVTSKLNEYSSGRYDISRLGRNDYTSHYENFYNRPNIITYPENNTGRRLLILGDSYSYWVTWLIGANFDKTFVHYTLDERDLDYNKFINDNGITDVLLLQYSARTLSKATSATKYLEQVITR